MAHATSTAAGLCQPSALPAAIDPRADELPPLGARPNGHATTFGLFTTTAHRCEVRLYGPGGEAIGEHALVGRGDGHFSATLPGVGPGALYKFVLDGKELPDPYARFLPQGVHGPAMVVESRHTFRHEGVYRPLSEQIIYELHVGTFTPEGTYAGASARLPELVALGVTAIELMPLAAFAGRHGWGYDGVALYAPHAPYGTPDELRALVDEAHRLGLAVFLDVVYNHFGPAGNYLSAYSPAYFTSAVKTGWGDAPDFAHGPMRRLVLDNALEWLSEFRFDGLRLDAVHAIVDPSPLHVLRELADRVAALEPRRLLIAEDERNDPADVTALGLNGIWADDFHHQVRVTLTGERDGYYAAYQPGAQGLARAIEGGWIFQGEVYPPSGKVRGKPAKALPAEAFVYCIQNHDQIGNRAMGDRLSHGVSTDAYCAASTLLLFLPMTPLLFMGQEWAASSPFQFFTDHDEALGRLVSKGRREEFKGFRAFSDPTARDAIPDPQARETFTRSQLRWDERTSGDHARVLALYRELVALRRSDPVLRDTSRNRMRAAAQGELLAVERWNESGVRLLLANLSGSPVALTGLPTDVSGLNLLVRSGGAGAVEGVLGPHTAVILSGPHPTWVRNS